MKGNGDILKRRILIDIGQGVKCMVLTECGKMYSVRYLKRVDRFIG